MSEKEIQIVISFLRGIKLLNSQDRKSLRQRIRWLESKISVKDMTNADLFQEELDATKKALDLSEYCKNFAENARKGNI